MRRTPRRRNTPHDLKHATCTRHCGGKCACALQLICHSRQRICSIPHAALLGETAARRKLTPRTPAPETHEKAAPAKTSWKSSIPRTPRRRNTPNDLKHATCTRHCGGRCECTPQLIRHSRQRICSITNTALLGETAAHRKLTPLTPAPETQEKAAPAKTR